MERVMYRYENYDLNYIVCKCLYVVKQTRSKCKILGMNIANGYNTLIQIIIPDNF